MWSLLRPAVSMVALCTVVLGLGYPLGITAVARAVVPDRAGGSLVVVDGVVVGARDIGQSFVGDTWLHGRPSVTADQPYNALSSAGSNLGPAHPALRERVAAAVQAERGTATIAAIAVPIDLVTTSASGLDPHITPAGAAFQIERIATARGLSRLQVEDAVARASEGRWLGIFGEPRVSVLAVNLALAQLSSTTRATPMVQ